MNVFNANSPYFSILVIVVLLLFIWVVWGSNERLIIEGIDSTISPATPGATAPATPGATAPATPGATAITIPDTGSETTAPSMTILEPGGQLNSSELTSAPPGRVRPRTTAFTLTPGTAGAQNAVLTINTNLSIKKDGILTLILPPEMEVPTTNPTLSPSAFGKVESVSNACDSDDLEQLLVFGIKKCNQATAINIRMNTASLTDDQLKMTQPIAFSLTGFKLPSYASTLNFEITSSTGSSESSSVSISGATGSPPAGGVDGDVTDCKFGITLSDDTPGAKLVTANYKFSFTNGPSGDLATFTIKKDKSNIYFLFSDDFQLPSVANIRVIVNKTTTLDSGKGEYTLVYKQKCKNLVSDELTTMLGIPNNFDSENKLCTNYYVLTLKKDIRVVSGDVTISLSGITNPQYYSPPAPAGKRDAIFKPFNSSMCILNIDTTLVSGKYLIIPTPSASNVGLYFRGNYPIKNTGGGSGGKHGDDAIAGGGSPGAANGSSGYRAANVYTVNYFYDGQGAGEYGHIAQPEIFGRSPYTYNSHKNKIMGSTSDRSIAQHYKDYYADRNRNTTTSATGQIGPQMGVAPSSLYGGVQPYNSIIRV